MKNVIITGSTGMVGGIVLNECLKSEKINNIISLVRKPGKKIHPKLKEVVISSFTDYSQYEELFKGIDIAYFCIGVYTGTVDRDEFRRITVDYTMAFANVLKKWSPNATFCFLSGAGADQTEKSRMMFAKDKGIAENYLFKTFTNAYSFRPAYIYPVEKRNEPNFAYKVSRTLYPLIKIIGKTMSIKSTELASAIFKAGISVPSKKVLENRDIIQFLKNID